MRRTSLLGLVIAIAAPCVALAQTPVDSGLAQFIAHIRAVDNHTHVNSTAPSDTDSDALPLDGIPPSPPPIRFLVEGPLWVSAYNAMYGYPYEDLSDAHVAAFRATMKRVATEQGSHFPEWVLDRIGTEVMIGNRIAMGPGLAPPRFRWASYVDALMLPLSTAGERRTPDQRVLYPLEEKLLNRYLAALNMRKVPPTLDAYLKTVVTPTLERQRKEGCLAVKLEMAYLRHLDFDDADERSARRIYAHYANGGRPTHDEYKTLEDFLFRYIARESGRLGMAVHIHSSDGGGGFYQVAGSDPLLMEPAFNDSTLRNTHFVIVHGGGPDWQHAESMVSKPNVYLDFSLMPLEYSPAMLANILRPWLTIHPEKVLFGTDSFASGPDAGWELAAWIGTTTARQALSMALTGMMRDGEINRQRAEEIATMVMRTNASTLYGLGLK